MRIFDITIGQLLFGTIAIILLVRGLILLYKKAEVENNSAIENKDKPGQTAVAEIKPNAVKKVEQKYAIVLFLVAILALFIAIFDPADTPKIRDLFNPKDNPTDSPGKGSATPVASPAVSEYPSDSFPATDTEGTVEYLSSAYDFEGKEHKNVLYMEGGSIISSFTIYTEGAYSSISFDYNAVADMDPMGRDRLRIYVDSKDYNYNEIAAIPEVNKSGSFDCDISGSKKVVFRFYGSEPTAHHPSAVFLSHIMVFPAQQ